MDNFQIIQIKCGVPSADDGTGSGGLWDLAGQIAFIAGCNARENGLLPRDTILYAEDFGQEDIYNLLQSYNEED